MTVRQLAIYQGACTLLASFIVTNPESERGALVQTAVDFAEQIYDHVSEEVRLQ